MISLSGDSILLRDDVGELHPQELDGLRAEVVEALDLTGRSDSAVADDLMRVVRHYAASAVRAGRVLDLDEVRALVMRALRDAGFAEAAAVMQGASPVVNFAESLISVDASEIFVILSRDVRFIGLDRQDLARRTYEALTAAGLTRLTAVGIGEVALSLAVDCLIGDEAEGAAGYWLLDGENWGGLLSGGLLPAVDDGRLRLYPVSRLAPVVEIVVDLRRFDDADTELALLPAVDGLLTELVATLADVPAVLARSCRDVVPEIVTGRLRMVGAESVGSGRLKLAGAHLYCFLDDLRKLAGGRLRVLPWITVEPIGPPATTRGSRKAAK